MVNITQAEATGAITDLLMTVMLIPFMILLIKTKSKSEICKYWLRFILYLTLSTFMGFIAHYFCKGFVFRLIWIPLYMLLFSTVNAFFLLAIKSCNKKTATACKIIFAMTAVFYIAVEYIELVLDKSAIRLYTVYAFIFATAGFIYFIYSAVKNKNKASKILLLTFPPLCIAGLFQIIRNKLIHIIWDFNEDGITHIFIMIAIIIMYAAGKTALNEDVENKNAVSV